MQKGKRRRWRDRVQQLSGHHGSGVIEAVVGGKNNVKTRGKKLNCRWKEMLCAGITSPGSGFKVRVAAVCRAGG